MHRRALRVAPLVMTVGVRLAATISRRANDVTKVLCGTSEGRTDAGETFPCGCGKDRGTGLVEAELGDFQGLFAKQPAAWSLHMTIVSGVNRTGRQDEASKNHNNSDHGNLLV